MSNDQTSKSTYSVREASELVALTRRQIRSLITEDVIHPERSASGRYRLAFTDIVLLRGIAQLSDDGVPMARIRDAVRSLRRELDEEADILGITFDARGRSVVVTAGDDSWDPSSGQVAFRLDAQDRSAEILSVRPRTTPTLEGATAQEWYAYADQLESTNPAAAEEAYRTAIELAPDFTEAHTDLGRLLHAAGAVREALAEYEVARELDPGDATIHFNLGVAFDDLRRDDEAIEAYRTALELAPRFADARYNLASVYERRGEVGLALQELRAYRDLVAGR